MEKKQLRDILIKKRITLIPDEKRLADEIIFNKITNLKEFKNCKCVLTYVSTKTEVDTRRLIEYSLMNAKPVAVPKCDVKTNEMRFYRIKSFDELHKGYFNILEPDSFCSEITDFKDCVCVVPGLAFNSEGFRLGYGRGYFDRFLNENDITSVGLCYKSFVIDDLPVEGFDKAVDILITD